MDKFRKSNELLDRAKKVTPLGAQTYSKSYRYYCGGNAPSFIDKGEADDKIIAVLNKDAVYGGYSDISDVPTLVIDRLRHYFLTYKDLPGEKRHCEITHIYGIEEAQDVIRRSMDDYTSRFSNIDSLLYL